MNSSHLKDIPLTEIKGVGKQYSEQLQAQLYITNLISFVTFCHGKNGIKKIAKTIRPSEATIKEWLTEGEELIARIFPETRFRYLQNSLIEFAGGLFFAGLLYYLRPTNIMILYATFSMSMFRLILKYTWLQKLCTSFMIGGLTVYWLEIYQPAIPEALSIISLIAIALGLIMRKRTFYSFVKFIDTFNIALFKSILQVLLILGIIFLFFITRVPNVVFSDEIIAAEEMEYAGIWPEFRNNSLPGKRIVVSQSLTPNDIIFTFPFWELGEVPLFQTRNLQKTITLELNNQIPKIEIKRLISTEKYRHSEILFADSSIENIIVEVNTIHNIVVQYSNMPENVSDLKIFLLVRSLRSYHPIFDRFVRSWWVQEVPEGPLINDGSVTLKAVFGRPQGVGERFEVIAIITNEELRIQNRIWADKLPRNAILSKSIIVQRI